MGRRSRKKPEAKKPEAKKPEARKPRGTDSEERPRRGWVLPAVLVAAAVGAMASGMGGGLLNWDDDRFVRDNELIRGFRGDAVAEIFAEPHFEAYHPLHLLSYCVDFTLYGLWAPGYKLHNLLLYCLCVVLLFLLLRRHGMGQAAAFAGALLFAVHPLHVEAVAWVTARKEPLSLAFMLGSALCYLRSTSIRDRFGIAALALFALALLTKTSTVMLPALLLLVDVLVRNKGLRSSAMRLLPMGLVAVGVGLYVISLWQENEMARPMPERGTLGLVALVGKTYWHYLSKLFWPAGLSPVYRIDRVGAFDGAAIAGYAVVAALALATWRRKDKLLTLGAAWFAVALLPVSNVIPVYFFVQDRYAFVATVGAAIVVARGYELFRQLPSSLWASRVAVAALAVALAVVAGIQGTYWQSSLALWQRATAVQPGSYYAFLALGHTERDRGDLDAAVSAYGRAVENAPELPHARISLCMADAMRVARRRGHSDAAVDQVGRALTAQWRSAEGLVDLSARLQRDGYAACAQLAEARAFDLDPPEPRDLVIAASRWTISGQGVLALRYLARARDGGIDEDDPTALEIRAQALELTGHHEEAREALRRSLAAEPRPEHRLVAAAAELLRRGRPELALLYADVAGREGQLTERWGEIRQQAEAARP